MNFITNLHHQFYFIEYTSYQKNNIKVIEVMHGSLAGIAHSITMGTHTVCQGSAGVSASVAESAEKLVLAARFTTRSLPLYCHIDTPRSCVHHDKA